MKLLNHSYYQVSILFLCIIKLLVTAAEVFLYVTNNESSRNERKFMINVLGFANGVISLILVLGLLCCFLTCNMILIRIITNFFDFWMKFLSLITFTVSFFFTMFVFFEREILFF